MRAALDDIFQVSSLSGLAHTIQLALADPKLPQTTRKFLDDHLRRLDRMDERKKARKEGSG